MEIVEPGVPCFNHLHQCFGNFENSVYKPYGKMLYICICILNGEWVKELFYDFFASIVLRQIRSR